MCRLTGWPRRAAHVSAERRGAAQHVEGRLERPFGIVLMGDRRAEQSEHGIAQVLGDKPAVAGDGLAERVEQRALEGPHLLGIEAFGERGEPAEVGEEDGDLPAVGLPTGPLRLCGRRDLRRLDQGRRRPGGRGAAEGRAARCPAAGTERKVGVAREAARGTGAR